MSKPTGIDQSWGFADPDVARKQLGPNGVVMMYLSPDPSKNASVAKIAAYHKVGLGVILGWESTANRALQGAAAGHADAAQALAQLGALESGIGYKPKTPVVIYFAVDFDTTPANYPQLDAYLNAARDVLHHAGELVGVYAEADYVEHTAGRKITDAEWQTYAWSGGRVAAAADFLQYLNGQTLGGASVDLDRIIHEHALGAWWPPSHPNNTGAGVDEKGTDGMDEKEMRTLAKMVAAELLDTEIETHDGHNMKVRKVLASIRKHSMRDTEHPTPAGDPS